MFVGGRTEIGRIDMKLMVALRDAHNFLKTLKPKFVQIIERFSSYLIGNEFQISYKSRSVNSVYCVIYTRHVNMTV